MFFTPVFFEGLSALISFVKTTHFPLLLAVYHLPLNKTLYYSELGVST